MQILIIQTAFIGDAILTTPVIEAIRKNFPASIIDFLAVPATKNLLESNPNLRKIIAFDKKGQDRGYSGIKRIGQQLAATKYDICIAPHRSWRSAYLAKKTNAGIRIGFNRSASPGVFTHIQTYRQNFHEIERNLSLLEALNIQTEIQLPRIYPTEEDKSFVEEKLKESDQPAKSLLVALAPGSVWPTKRWPSDYFIDLMKRIEKKGYQVVLIGGTDDIYLCEKIKEKGRSVVSMAGKFSLRQTYYLLTKCAALVTNDSAPLHLGLAAQISLYAIFGATTTGFGFKPFGPLATVVENKHLACRPCGIHGGYKCPTKTFECMTSLKPDFIETLIRKTGEPHIDE